MEINNLAPICLFTYNRLEETRQTIEALQTNFLAEESVLYIFSDGWKNEDNKEKVLEVRRYIKEIQGFKEVNVIESGENKGLAQSIITGVTRVLEEHDTVIVMEDDLISSPNFLDFMNQSLSYYSQDDQIQSISGFSLKIKENKTEQQDVYLHPRAHSWGWATWKGYWLEQLFDKEMIREVIKEDSGILEEFKKISGADTKKMLLDSLKDLNDSWYVRWCFNQFRNKRYTVYPFKSKIFNIGFSPEATHCKGINVFEINWDKQNKNTFSFGKEIDPNYIRQYNNYFRLNHKIMYRIRALFDANKRFVLLEDIKLKVKIKSKIFLRFVKLKK